jgi:NAD(P)-dependent dehydrogenase (short-subunit alcohol dehydrogenase family)
MCRPTSFPASPKKVQKQPPSSSFRCLYFVPLVLVVLTAALPVLISEAIGGWTKRYTSKSGFLASKIPDLTGISAVVTGANTGIGYETALELARNGADVIVASRSLARGEAAIDKMKQELETNDNGTSKPPSLSLLQLDLSSLDSVEQFAEEFLKLDKPLHLLVLNAGVMKSPGSEFIGQDLQYGFETTQDGFEYHIGVNHIAHAYLTQLLGPKLQASAPSRVVSVSSMAEQGSYEGGFVFDQWVPANGKMPETYEDGKGYGQSKLANLMYAKGLSEHWKDTGVQAYALHPGVIVSEISRTLEPIMEEQSQKQNVFIRMVAKAAGALFSQSLMSTPDGALTQLHLSVTPPEELENGAFYHPIGKVVTPTHPQATNAALRKQLWEETQKAIEMRQNYKYNQ